MSGAEAELSWHRLLPYWLLGFYPEFEFRIVLAGVLEMCLDPREMSASAREWRAMGARA